MRSRPTLQRCVLILFMCSPFLQLSIFGNILAEGHGFNDETKYFDRVTVAASKRWPWTNMLPNMIKCDEFLSKFQGRGLKTGRVNLIPVAKPLIFSISFEKLGELLAKWRLPELSFSLRWTFIYLNTGKIKFIRHVNANQHFASLGKEYI